MNPQKLFARQSDLYAKARPHYPSALYEWLARCCAAQQSVWDVGCGSGQAAADLRLYFDQVEATDVSPSQIANAPEYDRVRFSVRPAEATGFADNSFDAVCVAQALHWFDYEQFWPEVKRVLRTQGVFAAWGYNWPHVDPAIDEILETRFLATIQPYWSPGNRLLWNGYRDIPFPFDPIETPDIEFTLRWSLDEFFAYLRSWSATRRCIEAIGDDFATASQEAIQARWGAGQRDVSMDFVLIAGRSPQG